MLQLRAHISFSLPHFVAAAAAAAAAAVFSVRIAFSLIFSYSGHKEQEDDGKSVPGFARALAMPRVESSIQFSSNYLNGWPRKMEILW